MEKTNKTNETKVNTYSMNTMNANLKKLFNDLNVSNLPKIESEIQSKAQVHKRIIEKNFSKWLEKAKSQEARNTVSYFYTLSLYEKACNNAIVETLKKYEKEDDEEYNETLLNFGKALQRKAKTLLKKGNNLQKNINEMYKAFCNEDSKVFNLYFDRFFGFEITKEEMRDFELLALQGKTIASANALRDTLISLFTVLQQKNGTFSKKAVKTTFKHVTSAVLIYTKEDAYIDGNIENDLKEDFAKHVLSRYKIDFNILDKTEMQKKAKTTLKKYGVEMPKELNEIQF